MDKTASLFSGNNAAFLDELYQAYLKDPASVDVSWHAFFAEAGQPRSVQNGNGFGSVLAESDEHARLEEAVARMIHTYRLRGHLSASLDPLQQTTGTLHPTLSPSYYGLSAEHLDRLVQAGSLFVESRVPLREILRRLRETYCRTVGVEYMHMPETEARMWLQAEMETCENKPSLTTDEKRLILTKLAYADGFEQFLHTKFQGAKRFSLSGNKTLIPLLDAALDEAGKHGVQAVVIGMAHRGRLNVLANILKKPLADMMAEFEANYDPREYLGGGDVKYHMGYSNEYQTQSGHSLHLSLAFNPSHLEAIDPVVLGRVRAKQDRHGDFARSQGMGLLIHGDAAFAGQGIVAETLNLAGLEGYTTGGTVHVVVNNQIGFTTFPEDSRSTDYATDIAHMMKIPIFHVNGDDPEAVVYVARLAQRFRQRFKKSVVIDLIGFRRYGHNETDDPTFTQPQMYKLIRDHASVRKLYAEKLVAEGVLSQDEAEGISRSVREECQQALDQAKAKPGKAPISSLEGAWKGYLGGADRSAEDTETGVPLETLKGLAEKLTTLPEGFTPHQLTPNLLKARAAMGRGEQNLDWAMGESLAFASLLSEGARVRLAGQDSRRGTFTQRHAVFTDARTGARYTPLCNLAPEQGTFEVIDSPLSEAGVLGFEYGYSLDMPESLVIWEAQFGDFVNNAQVVIDQFLSSGEDKWHRLSGLVLFLPHGYEGQGPEHSSARIERFLQLCAEDNLQVVNPTTPAQIFHALRRQVVRKWRKPLVVFTPKSLLRNPAATSPLAALAAGRFQRVIADEGLAAPEAATRAVLCSGKVYYDLAKERAQKGDTSTAIVRVEQLHPFPAEQLQAALARHPKLSEVFWAQEEPENMGPWGFVAPRLAALLGPSLPVRYVGREASASPATGSDKAHAIEQQSILRAIFP